MNLEVIGATFERTGEDSDRHTVGIVVVEFTMGRSATFDDVREDKFERWVESCYDDDLVPFDMSDAWSELTRPIVAEEEEDEDLDEDFEDEDEEEEEIHPLDFIGQHTGIPSPGFPKPPFIAEDDFIGQYTGFPTPGHVSANERVKQRLKKRSA